eukprot:CAMPEP_0195520914 /NCGR_PEP_ID=MMETSP0794_2-20130614/17617_1 /TAXON_ID=515487 /ORGANISM="Stephanopyxis turris, Strain CCMP 815" /LENGTH=199 /DNA_ID=CAMNT_0040650357 /DNA_START=405 /DNA_END=1004 /DNA_ORIENTATION=+
MNEPHHLDPINPAILHPHNPPIVSIDTAHRRGLIHHGTLFFVSDANRNLLFLKRSATLVTCPNTWMPPGEHQEGKEELFDTLKRGVTEELGPAVWELVTFTTNITPFPLYYIRHYGRENGDRVDRQITSLWFVQLGNTSSDVAESKFVPDEEVAGSMWLSLEEAEAWLRQKPNDFCHETIRDLVRVGLDALKRVFAADN